MSLVQWWRALLSCCRALTFTLQRMEARGRSGQEIDVFDQCANLIGDVGGRSVRGPSGSPGGEDVALLGLGRATSSFGVQVCEGPSGLSFPSKEDKSFLTCVLETCFYIRTIVSIIITYSLLFTFFLCFPK